MRGETKLSQKTTLLKEPCSLRPLSEVLPLNTPFSILIDPCNICNFKCSFCPSGYPELIKKVSRSEGMMEFDLFCKVIDDLQEFDEKLEKINLYKDGEPFLNKYFGKMIVYTKEKNVGKNVSTTTNGSVLNKTRAKEVLDAGLDTIRISVEHVSDPGYEKITKTKIKYDTIKKNIEFLYNEREKRKKPLTIHVKMNDIGFSNDEKEKFIHDFDPISDTINFNPLTGWNNTHGVDFTLGLGSTITDTSYAGSPAKSDRKVCPDSFYTMAVNFDGSVSLCCADWSYGALIGDVKGESLANIWKGEKLQQFRLLHLRGERKNIKICSDCDVLTGAPMDSDLDAAATDLLEKYK
tara:strand:+ start:20793 stop:21842 length:1050 start_codon:yes stop_codon:yes gene_type:complete